MKIIFLTAGGTIDKDYASCAGTYNFDIAEPAIERILKNINVNFDYEIIPVLKKDSLDMDDKDRALLLEKCQKIDNDKIIITHGTDTMHKTAEVLSVLSEKLIILTGATNPERFKCSDADINIGIAIGAINILSKGVFIAMNGRVYKWDEFQKQSDTGIFIEK